MPTWICADAKPVRVLKLSTFALNCTALKAVLSRSCCGSCAPPARKCRSVGKMQLSEVHLSASHTVKRTLLPRERCSSMRISEQARYLGAG